MNTTTHTLSSTESIPKRLRSASARLFSGSMNQSLHKQSSCQYEHLLEQTHNTSYSVLNPSNWFPRIRNQSTSSSSSSSSVVCTPTTEHLPPYFSCHLENTSFELEELYNNAKIEVKMRDVNRIVSYSFFFFSRIDWFCSRISRFYLLWRRLFNSLHSICTLSSKIWINYAKFWWHCQFHKVPVPVGNRYSTTPHSFKCIATSTTFDLWLVKNVSIPHALKTTAKKRKRKRKK